MTFVKFNINREVHVVFHPKALEALRAYYRIAVRKDENLDALVDERFPGWREGKPQRMQMWVFMEIFGPYTHIGTPPFDPQIELEMESPDAL